MIRYFKVNDPYRLLAVLIFLVVTRIVALVLENPFLLLHTESEGMGTAINNGAFFIEGLSTNAGPLYYYLYAVLTFFSDNTLWLSVILATSLVMVQAFLLNAILIRSAALNDNTYLPAIIYTFLLSSSPEFLFLSPELLSITFVLLGLNFLFIHLKYRGSEENIISTGFMFGIAALFTKPAFLLLLFILLIYLFYSSTLTRRYFLMAFGFFLPFIAVWIYFLWNGVGADFWSNYFSEVVHLNSRQLIPGNNLLIWLGFPALLALITAAQNFTGIGMTNNQIQIQRSMLWLAIFGGVLFLLSANGSFSELIMIMPVITYFIVMFLNSVEKPWMGELFFQILLWGSIYFLLTPLIDQAFYALDISGLISAAF